MCDWDEFYARNLTLPIQAKTQHFLQHLDQNAYVLDAGSGNGRWSAAFQRDRPDLTIDLVDRNLPNPSFIPHDWKGNIYQSDLQTFEPTRCYDGIWANNILFFMTTEEISSVFHKLADRLTSQGIIQFTMLQDGSDAPFALTSLSLNAICSLLRAENLEPLVINLDKNTEYMVADGRRKFPTFHVQAKKTYSWIDQL